MVTFIISCRLSGISSKLLKPKEIDRSLQILFSRLIQKDVEAFSGIYKLFYNRLLRYGSIIHPETELVEDVIQDLFIWIFQHPEKIENVKNFEIYLFQSLKRNLLTHLKRQERSRHIFREFVNPKNVFNENTEERIIQQEIVYLRKEWLHHQLHNLPAKLKEVIYLRYYEGLSYEEITELLSTSNQVVRNYIYRALNQLRERVPAGSKNVSISAKYSDK